MTDITIQGYKFEVPEAVLAGYAPGATIELDEGTASTLRQVKCENLRNNFAGEVKKSMNGGSELTPEQLQELQQKFASYAQEYKFGVRRAGGGGSRRVTDPMEKEILRLAKEDISQAFKARHGKKIEKEQLDAAVENLLSARRDDYTKRARTILRERDKIAENTLEAAGL